jgi:hypothetical protein
VRAISWQRCVLASAPGAASATESWSFVICVILSAAV